jgi:IS30 family transposase
VISVTLYQTIQEWHAADVEKREIARRLRLDTKTVRRHIRKMLFRTCAADRERRAFRAASTSRGFITISPLTPFGRAR